MRKTVLILSIIFLTGLLSACGLIPVPKQGLMEGERPVTVEIEGYVFHEEIIMEGKEGGKMIFKIDLSSPLRDDEISKAAIGVVKERFPEALRERGLVVTTGATIKVRVDMAYGKTGIIMIFLGRATVKKGEFTFETKDDGWCYADPAGPLFSPDGWRNLHVAKSTAKIVTDRVANALVILLREKGEIRGEKK